MKILTVGAELSMRTDGRTDGQREREGQTWRSW